MFGKQTRIVISEQETSIVPFKNEIAVNENIVDGEVMDDEIGDENFFRACMDSLKSYFERASQSRTSQRAASRTPPTDGNGMYYNARSDNWEYTAEANGDGNPFECNVKIIPGYGADSATDYGL